jgi:Replication-relaxation
MEMLLRYDAENARTPSLPDLRFHSADRPVRKLFSDHPSARGKTVRLTERCSDLLKLLRTARWLTTAQIQRRFFRSATADAVRKRLRKLSTAGYVVAVRHDRMSQALFRLGPEGKRVLETLGGEPIVIDRKPPVQRQHSEAINDFRIAAEIAGDLRFFYAAWELPRLGWNQPIIPDGLVGFGDQTFAIEVDTGVEGIQFFVRSKMPAYGRGFDNLPLSALLIVADRTARISSLATAIGDRYGRVLFTTMDLIVGHSLLAPIFYSQSTGWGVSVSSQTLSTSGEFLLANHRKNNNFAHFEHGLLRQEGAKHGTDNNQ